MAKVKYYYDTETCKYEKLRFSASDIVINSLGFAFVALIFAAGLVYVYTLFFQSPKEMLLAKENEELTLHYEILNKEIEQASERLNSLQEKDNDIYRIIFEAKPIPSSVRNSNININRYKELLSKGLEKQELIAATTMKLEMLMKKIKIQHTSYEEILVMAKNKSQMLASIPAIQPISNKELTHLASGFGMRIHPIYKVKRMHTGCDFAAVRGSQVYATGDGVVRLVTVNPGGYGKEIEIDHGYGYVTKYAHLEAFNVHVGQRIKRGELIGFVGNTGASTAPHLHYEVIKNGVKVDPVHFFFNDLNPAEYERILQLASVENQSLS
jgi:hypothetical protein